MIELNEDLEIETVDFEEILEDGISININIDEKFNQIETNEKIKNEKENKEKKCNSN